MIHCRDHLISWLLKNVTDRVLHNVLETGVVENLGVFNPLPTSDQMGFIVQLISLHETAYNIAIVIGACGKYRWFRIKEFSWVDWAGDNTTTELYRGDRPKIYQTLKKMRGKNEVDKM